MRKIEKEVIGAFVDGKTKTMGNTASALNPKTRNLDLLLHGNRIAVMSNRDGVKKLWVSNAGWSSRTTQSRLNALFSLLNMPERVYIKGGTQYLDSSRHNTINLSALRKSAVLVYERFDASVVDDGPVNWPSFRDELADQPKPLRDAAYQLFLNQKL
jgi:hypothetical protein